MSKKHIGSSIDSFLKKEGVFKAAQAQAIKEAVAWQLAQAMKKKKDFQGADGHAPQDQPDTG